MKVFLSHKFTGISYEELEAYLWPIKAALEQLGYDVFCSLWLEPWFTEQGWTQEYIYERCQEQQACCDEVVGVIRHETPSHGMELELQKAKALGQPYVLIVKDVFKLLPFVKPFTAFASRVIVVQDIVDLGRQV